MTMLKAASEGAVFGGVGGAQKDGTVMIAGAAKPTLGRYEIEKELGPRRHGHRLSGQGPQDQPAGGHQDHDAREEGDAAGDQGGQGALLPRGGVGRHLEPPEHRPDLRRGRGAGLSYIAMELLDGQGPDPVRQRTSSCLPFPAMEYVATVADALDYAHAQGIVHRDIKPANIMLLKDGTIRVADFGIARITASSKTATGTVMGTPSYMSPEQVAGKKVDGRADLFSLTVALYEFLTGEKPFKGGEGIGTLLFQIANDPHPDILTIRPGPAALRQADHRQGLAKEPDERYARGSLLAADLRCCIAAVKSGIADSAPVPISDEVLAAVASAAGCGSEIMAKSGRGRSAGDHQIPSLSRSAPDATLQAAPAEKEPPRTPRFGSPKTQEPLRRQAFT